MSDKERQSILVKTSFKNVSGNWQFKGDMTPERFLRIIEGVHSTRINQQQNLYGTRLLIFSMIRQTAKAR